MIRTMGVLAALALAALMPAESRPDFSGTWKLDTLRSRFDSKAKPPKSATLTLEQHGTTLRLDLVSEGGALPEKCDFELPIDGTEVQAAGSGGTYSASAQWGNIDGTHLILVIKRNSPEGTVVTSRQMKLGEDQRILTTVLTTTDTAGDKKAYEFYNRQPQP